jgi:hypothetical protein
MADKVSYEISLEIEGADRVNSQVDRIDRALQDVSKNAKSLNFEAANQTLAGLERQMNEIAESGEDATKQMEAFDRASGKAYADLERSAVRLNYSISEQGKAQRERIKELEQERAALDKTAEGKARAREIDKEIAGIRKQVVDVSDDELNMMIKQNVQARARIKLMQQTLKSQKTEQKQQKTLKQLIAEDLKPLKEKIAAQKEFIKSLSTTEGRYLALKKAAKGVYNLGGKALKGAGMVAGAAMAIGGMAIASAGKQVEQETEARRIKGSGSLEEKQNLLLDLYAQTGADYSSIVDAINRVYGLLGNISKDEMMEAATAEIKMPGAAAILRQQNTAPVKAQDFTAYLNRMRSIQGFTGASNEQITNSTNYISNLRQRSFSNASEAELQTLYLALQNSGAYDNEEELQRAFGRFVRIQRDSGEDVFALAQKWQNNGEWLKTSYGATNKTQAANTLKNLDFGKMGEMNRKIVYDRPEETAAEKTAREMRDLEVTKDKFLIQVLKAIQPLLENDMLSKILESGLKLIGKLAEFLIPVLEKIAPYVDKFIEYILKLIGLAQSVIEGIMKQNEEQTQRQVNAAQEGSTAGVIASRSGLDHVHADGGIAAIPSICGEGGFPEFVIPTDPARRGRAEQIMAQVSQTFNMSGSETTAMSLAQAVRSRQFAYETGRIGMLNRRLGGV